MTTKPVPPPLRVDVHTFGTVLTDLADLGPPSAVRNRGPEIAAHALDLDRVLLASVSDGLLSAESLHLEHSDDAVEVLERLRAVPVALSYPLMEGEVVRRRRHRIVRPTSEQSPDLSAFAEVLGRVDYVVAPVLVDGQVLGMLRGDRSPSGREVHDDDASALAIFATCFALVFERAALRYRLRAQREELRRMAQWAEARSSDVGADAFPLSGKASAASTATLQRLGGTADRPLLGLLTTREIDVLRLLARGETNAGIARNLVVAEGTVKFHVKNILRKLNASNRAEATSRFLGLAQQQVEGKR